MTTVPVEHDALFKKVDAGWVFRAPNPRIFGDTPHYLVSAAQKAELSKLLTVRHPIRLGLLIALAIIAWIVAVAGFALLAGLDADKASAGELAIMIAMFVLALLPVLPIISFFQLRRLRPVLMSASLTTERITNLEIVNAVNVSYSRTKALSLAGVWLFSGLMQGVTLGIRNAHHPLFGDAQSNLHVIALVASLIAATRFIVIAMRK
jgi:hypothetical protein